MILRPVLRFGLVGLLATLVHMAVGYTLIQAGWHALIANLLAFITAFFVSFTGHLVFSFADHTVKAAHAFWKFIIVAVAGFCVNEALLATLLHLQALPSAPALFVSTAFAAFVTFFLSRAWAFKHTPASTPGSAPKGERLRPKRH